MEENKTISYISLVIILIVMLVLIVKTVPLVFFIFDKKATIGIIEKRDTDKAQITYSFYHQTKQKQMYGSLDQLDKTSILWKSISIKSKIKLYYSPNYDIVYLDILPYSYPFDLCIHLFTLFFFMFIWYRAFSSIKTNFTGKQ